MIYAELSDLLYHGSTTKVCNIDLSKSVSGKDFGRGFYTTASRYQTEKFALIKAKRMNGKNGFVSVFQYIHNHEIKIKKFEKADTEWLSFVLENRGFYKRPKNELENSFDIVIGPVANDTVGLVLNQLLIGTYGDPLSPEARDTAIRLLDATRLYGQIFFRTERSYLACNFWRFLKLELTDDLIEGVIDSIAGFIVAKAAEQYNKPIAEVMNAFLVSHTYQLLSDKDTGLYWDNLSDTYTMFVKELPPAP
jgi:hypothetical protein